MASSSSSASHVRLMCSFGGRILPRPHDHLLRYVGGESRIVSVPRSSSFASLLSLLSNISPDYSPTTPPTIKYQLPNEDLDALISLTCDEDVDNMMHELDRLLSSSSSSSSAATARSPRLRLFLFPPSSAPEPFGSIFDAGAGDWFLDALNGVARQRSTALHRLRSEASSVASEVPDYLFGLDDLKSVVESPRYSSTSSLVPESKPLRTKTELEEKPDSAPVFYMPAPVHGPAQPVQFVHSVGGPIPVQFAAPVHGAVPGAIYMGGTYGYGAPTGGGSMRNPSFIPVYDPAGGSPAAAGSQMRYGFGSASQ
ncbi:uncharacterized protein [Typha angustifolia]|uniref:uncharacterized protein n=1 Tax=Typha angustifolia TaxID=59011 RepID=UPI003C301C1A